MVKVMTSLLSITCPQCGAVINNPQAQNCNRCGMALFAILPQNTLVAGQYRVLTLIKEGGSGQIYVVADTRTFDRQCVLKRTLLKNDPAARQQFVSEAQMLTKLRHPQIPQVFAYFEEHGSAYIVMEYITGHDLEMGLSHYRDDGTFVAGKPRDLKQTLHDGIVVCTLLEYLHSRKPAIIHCDIKPANMIRDRDSNALFLVDFGAAAATNGVFGTPGYAAPEQYQQQRSPASDIYALGATLYHLLTDDDPTEHPRQFPKLSTLPKIVMQTLQRALMERASNRPSASDFKELLEDCLHAPGVDITALTFPSGATPHTMIELAREMYNDWSAAHTFVANGKIATWLRQNNYVSLAGWVEQNISLYGATQAVDLLLQRLIPNLPNPEVIFDQSYLELPADDQTITQLKVYANGGAAQLSVQHVPAWLQIAPTTATVLPQQPVTFNIKVMPDMMPRFNLRDKIVFVYETAGFRQTTCATPVRLIDSPHGQRIVIQSRHASSLQLLLTGWMIVITIMVFALMVIPETVLFFLPMSIGTLIGMTAAWIYAEDSLDTVLMIGGAAGAGMAGRMFYSWSTGQLSVDSLNPTMLIFAVGAAVLTLMGYLWFKR